MAGKTIIVTRELATTYFGKFAAAWHDARNQSDAIRFLNGNKDLMPESVWLKLYEGQTAISENHKAEAEKYGNKIAARLKDKLYKMVEDGNVDGLRKVVEATLYLFPEDAKDADLTDATEEEEDATATPTLATM